MAVTFGTPVRVDMVSSTSAAFVMSGVTSGQPIILYWASINSSAAAPLASAISDTFSTPYLWTKVVNGLCPSGYGAGALYVGTGGSGISGTITITYATTIAGGAAFPCTGASTASGLSAIDASASGTSTNTPYGFNSTTIVLAPTAANEGALVTIVNQNSINSTSGDAGYASGTISYSSLIRSEYGTKSSTPSGTDLNQYWNLPAAIFALCLGLIVKAQAVVKSSSFFPFFN
jgi:hypothetical protein